MRVLARSSLLAVLLFGGCNSATPPTAPNAMLVDGAGPAATGVAGRWVGVGHGVTGSVRYSVQGDQARLDFSDDFTVSPSPGPFVYVNTTNNANTGRPLRVAALRSNSGAQSYVFALPAGTTFTWVLLWCDPFNVALAETRIPAP